MVWLTNLEQKIVVEEVEELSAEVKLPLKLCSEIMMPLSVS